MPDPSLVGLLPEGINELWYESLSAAAQIMRTIDRVPSESEGVPATPMMLAFAARQGIDRAIEHLGLTPKAIIIASADIPEMTPELELEYLHYLSDYEVSSLFDAATKWIVVVVINAMERSPELAALHERNMAISVDDL